MARSKNRSPDDDHIRDAYRSGRGDSQVVRSVDGLGRLRGLVDLGRGQEKQVGRQTVRIQTARLQASVRQVRRDVDDGLSADVLQAQVLTGAEHLYERLSLLLKATGASKLGRPTAWVGNTEFLEQIGRYLSEIREDDRRVFTSADVRDEESYQEWRKVNGWS